MRRTINGEENRYARARACDPQRFKIRVCRLRHRYLGYNRRLSLSLSLSPSCPRRSHRCGSYGCEGVAGGTRGTAARLVLARGARGRLRERNGSRASPSARRPPPPRPPPPPEFARKGDFAVRKRQGSPWANEKWRTSGRIDREARTVRSRTVHHSGLI